MQDALEKYLAERNKEYSTAVLFQLVKKGKLAIADAAEASDMLPQEFEKRTLTYEAANAEQPTA